MDRAQIKSGFRKLSFIAVGLLMPLIFAAPSYADLPYFKATGGDIFAGGWFNDVQNSCSNDTNFQAPPYNPWDPSKANKGGIMAFVNGTPPPVAGSSAQLGAYALGVISNGSSSNGTYGFFAGGDGGNSLSFANNKGSANIANYFGGVFENARLDIGAAHQSSHCIADYYSTKQNSPALYVGNVSDYSVLQGQYIFKNPGMTILNSVPVTIAGGKKITLFVNGDAYIGANISYGTGVNGYNDSNVPKFAVVVRGNIYIDPSVTNLDGLYIAQPDTTNIGNTGAIWTCHDNSSTNPKGDWLYNNCRANSLSLNGGFIAKQIQLTRVKGDVGTAGSAAEIFNYTPEMVVNGGFFGQTDNFGKIQSLVNLPPVF